MAALTIGIEANITLTVGTSAELLAANAARKGFVMQNQSSGVLWCKLGGAASIDDGFAIGPGMITTLEGIAGGGGAADNYQGAVEGILVNSVGVDGIPIATGVIRVLELE